VLVSWAPDNRSVLVAQDFNGDERYQLFRVELDHPGVMWPLTESSPAYYLHGGQLHPNGRWLVYGANWDVGADQEIEPTWLYRHDLATGERIPLARPQRAHYYEPNLNDPGTHVLYQRNDLHPGGLQVWLADIEGREDREILNAGPEKKASASWFPGGRHAIVLAETDSHRRVGVWDQNDNLVRWVLDDPARNARVAFVPHGSEQAVLLDAREARWYPSLLDVESGEEKPLDEVPGTLIPLAPLGGDRWLGKYYHSRQPMDLVLFDWDHPQPDAFVSLTRVWERTSLRSEDLAPAEDLRWQSVDGLEIQGWLYRARGQARGTIVHIHGGPSWHIEDWVNAQVQYLVSEGFHVLQPNYRGSTGFSLDYREAIKEDGWGGREQQDVRTGIEALIAAGIAKPGKVGVTGTSYGGYSSWYAITRFPPEIVAASAPICGMTDLVVDWETTRPDLRPYSEEMMGGSPEEVPERYHRRSPLHSVDRIQGRLLIIQGMQDPNVTPENVRVVKAALDEEGIEYELLTFEDEGHGIHKPRNHRILYPRLVEFFGAAFAEG
jgi:dipeptidyl aminopeptidase/acylaminoacyl peptidase